jgi:methylated-DNA-[protein]-cysteine S-methyltransferase
MDKLITGYITSPLGTIRLQHSAKGICSLIFVDHELPEAEHFSELDECKQQLNQYFGGTRKGFNLILDLDGTAFQMKIWAELLKISFGNTLTYADLSRKIGDMKSIRAVGRANATNPVSIIVPCHRVIGSDGSLTGYAGGLWRKKWLLEHEQKHFQLSLF